MKTRRFTKYAAPVLVLGLLFFACKKKEEAGPKDESAGLASDTRVLATVNGDPITLGDFQERFIRAGLKPEREVELQVKEEFLSRLIERKMMLREAQRRRIKVGLPEINQRIEALRKEQDKDIREVLAGQGVDFEKWKSDLWEDMMIEKLIGREVSRHADATQAEVRRYYQAHPEEFNRPDQVRVRQIVLSSEAEAQAVMGLLHNKADFAVTARQKSTAPEAASGGDLGYFSRGEMPAEFNVVFDLPKGGVSSVVKSPYGYHIFKLEDKRRAGKISLEEAYKDLAEKLRRQKQDHKYQQWLKELRNRTKFVVNYQALGQ